MSEMEVTETENDCSNDLLLLDRVFLRLGNADTDEQLESCLNRFLPPVILKLSSPHEQVRTKVMELLVHVNKRVKCRADVKLPVETLLNLYTGPTANSFIINFTIIYITMGFPRMAKPEQVALAPVLLNAIENKPQAHQDSILMLVMPLLGDIKESALDFSQHPRVGTLVMKMATDVLLLPYRALPSDNQSDFQVPPGFSLRSYKRIVDKHVLSPTQLEEMKLSIVTFISKSPASPAEALLPLTVAAADSRFAVANAANSPLIRAASSVDWSSPAALGPLYSLYLGSPARAAAADKRAPACTRLRLKLIQYLNRSTGPAVMFPQCVQVVFSSLFEPNSNPRLRNLALVYLLNVINNGSAASLSPVAPVFLQGLLKLIKSEDYAEHHAKAYQCLGKLTRQCPATASISLLEQLVAKIPSAEPELRTALRDALLDMATALRIDGDEAPDEDVAMDTEEAGSSTGSKKAKMSACDEPQALALFALLDHYLHSDESMIRYVGVRYAASVLPPGRAPATYLLLLASGDSQDEIASEALKCLYGTSRPSEIEDVVNNVTRPDSAVANLDNDQKQRRTERPAELKAPPFDEIVEYIWSQAHKRRTGSNAKHRFVVNNQVLQFHPRTYHEILRYLRLCLNRAAELRDCGPPPHAASPRLARHVRRLLHAPPLQHYLEVATTLLAASPDLMPLTCLLEMAGAAPEAAAPALAPLLPQLKTLFTTSTKEEIRETAAALYAIVFVETSDSETIEKELQHYIVQANTNKNLESQAGHVSAMAAVCERALRTGRGGGGGGGAGGRWPPFRGAVECLAALLSSPQTLLVNTACANTGLLVRCAPLPLDDISDAQQAILAKDNPFNVGEPIPRTDNEVTKFSIVAKLFAIVGNAKLPSKLKERALYTLGLLCCSERFPFARDIVNGFLMMAKDSKEFEIHLQVGEALALCADGVNCNETRDYWTELPKEGADKVKDPAAAAETDALLAWLLDRLLGLVREPHPHSRQATSVWLLALLRSCSHREPARARLQRLQDAFMDLLSENSEIVQDVASKGLSLVYQSTGAGQQQALVAQIIDQLTSGARSVARVTDDTKVFEEGQLGKSPTGGNLSTYKELCSLASDLNQPDLLYKFMHLAHHNSVWNSKKGAAFGFHSIALQAGEQLSQHLPKIVPRLYRYRFDPTPRTQQAMAGIWHALVPDTQATVQKYYEEILSDLAANLTSAQWRVRLSSCAALAELARTGGVARAAARLPDVLPTLFRVMDDVHEGTRHAASACTQLLLKMIVRASDAAAGKDGRALLAAALPALLDCGITHVVREVRAVSLQTVSKLVSAAGDSLKPFLPTLIPALLTAAGDLESAKLSYLSTALGTDSSTRQALDDLRADAAKQHYTTDTVVKCMPFLDIELMTEMLPKVLELMKTPQLGTKVACCHFLILAGHNLRSQLEPISGKIMLSLLNGSFDRNATVRKNYAEALGQISAYAKPSSVEKLMRKLVAHADSRDDEAAQSAVALALKAVARARPEHLRDHEQLVAPLVFLAMHGDKDGDSSPAALYSELWSETSAGAAGVRRLLPALRPRLEAALADPSWPRKVQAADAIQTLSESLPEGLGAAREGLARALLAAARGKTFDGKPRLLRALATVCSVKPGEAPLNPSVADECVAALLAESRKSEMVYKREALSALGDALAALNKDRFDQLYDIVKLILSKDPSSRDSDSDSECAESGRARREQLAALQEAAYELLGKAWPANKDTQDKYQDIFFEHCSAAFAASARSTQLAVLGAMARVLARLRVLAAEGMEVDGGGRDATTRVTDHVVSVVEYTLKNSNQVRHRREALNLIEILVKKLKDINRPDEVQKLRTLFASHVKDLSKEESHEIRSKVDNIKVYFK